MRQTRTNLRALTTLIFVCFCTISIPLKAYNYRQLTNADGLSCSLIIDICQDSKGFMWFGSFDGLNMYDGNSIKVYKSTKPQNSFSSHVFRRVIETQDGVFWLRTNLGLNKLTVANNEVKKYYQTTTSQIIIKDSLQHLYAIVKPNTLSLYDEKTDSFKEVTVEGLNNEYNVAAEFDHKNRLWVFQSDGQHFELEITTHPDGSLKVIRHAGISYNERPKSLFYHDKKFYYVDMNDRFFVVNIDNHSSRFLGIVPTQYRKNGAITSIVPITDSEFIFSFEIEGLFRFRTHEGHDTLMDENLNIKCGIYKLYYDRKQDILWVATAGEGVYVLWNDNYHIRNITNNRFPVALTKPVRALLLDKRKNLWIGTNGEGIVRINNFDYSKTTPTHTNTTLFNKNQPINHQIVFSFCESVHNDIIWIGGDWTGLTYYSYKDNKVHSTGSNSRERGNYINFVHEIVEQNDSTLWIGTFGMGLLRAVYDPKSFTIRQVTRHTFFKQFGGNSEVSYERINSMYKENDSILWVGARMNGVVRLNMNTSEHQIYRFEKEGIEQLNDILSIHKDVAGRLWFGSNFGLIKTLEITPKEITYSVINEQSGLTNNAVNGISSDRQGTVYISHNKGVDIYYPQSNKLKKLNARLGLQLNEFSLDAYYSSPDFRHTLFGGTNGICVINEDRYKKGSEVLDIHFMGISIFDENFDLSEFTRRTKRENYIRLNYKQNFFSITFATPNYNDSYNTDFSYQLENYSNRWIDAVNNSATFTNIAPGTYKLRIRRKLDNNQYLMCNRALIIHITPPWYLSNVAIIIYILTLICAIYGAIMYYKRKRRAKQQIEIEQLNQKQKKEAYDARINFWNKISSEFATPLTLIANPCQLLLEYEKEDQYIISNLQHIQENTERMSQLVRQLEELRHSNYQNAECVISNLNILECCTESINKFSSIASRMKIDFQVEIDKNIQWNSNQTNLQMILNILLSRVFKQTRAEGKIQLICDNSSPVLKFLFIHSGDSIAALALQAEMDRLDILDNFQNTDTSFEESLDTLNLGICSNLIHSLKGSINVSDINDNNTVLEIELPYLEITIPEHSKNTKQHAQHKQQNSNDKLPNIIFIDFNQDMASFVTELLSQEYTMLTAENEHATATFLLSKHIDLIILNSSTNESNLSIINKLKTEKHSKHIPLIFIANNNEEANSVSENTFGADAYINKPFKIAYLKNRIHTMLQNADYLRKYYSSSVSIFEKENGQLVHRDDKLFLNQVVEIVEENILNEDLNGDFIADKLKISRRNLQRRLHDLTNMSTHNFIKSHKMTMCAYKLRNTKITIQEIMFQVGFNNRAHFYQEFTKKYGVAPGKYRQEQADSIDE